MPRIRTIKPEFWADEKLAPHPPITRLVFLGLIGMADDAGRLVDNQKQIDAFIFPETGDSSKESLQILEASGRIRRGITESGQRVIQIVNWHHQKIDKPNVSAALPPIVDESATDRRHVGEASAPHIGTSISTNDLLPASERSADTSPKVPRYVGDTSPNVDPRLTTEGQQAMAQLLRASQNPKGLAAEIRMILDGGRAGVPADPAVVSLALVDISTNGDPPRAELLRRYVQKAASRGAAAAAGRSPSIPRLT